MGKGVPPLHQSLRWQSEIQFIAHLSIFLLTVTLAMGIFKFIIIIIVSKIFEYGPGPYTTFTTFWNLDEMRSKIRGYHNRVTILLDFHI